MMDNFQQEESFEQDGQNSEETREEKKQSIFQSSANVVMDTVYRVAFLRSPFERAILSRNWSRVCKLY